MTTKQLTYTKRQTLAVRGDALLIWRAVRGMWKNKHTTPLKYQRAVRKERAL